MCRANPLWGAPRIHGELLKLGLDVSEATVSKFMIRDRDAIYGNTFWRQVTGLGIEEVLTALRSPWQNPYVERGRVIERPHVGGLHHEYFRKAA